MKSRSKKKSPHAAPRPALNPTLKEELLRFMKFHSAKRLSKNLRTMLLEFLMYDGTAEAVYFKDLVNDLEGLFRFLEAIESTEKDLRV
jgi:hypothetical protein